MTRGNIVYRLELESSDGEGLAWVYRHGLVLQRSDEDGRSVVLRLSANPLDAEKIEKRFEGKIYKQQDVVGNF